MVASPSSTAPSEPSSTPMSPSTGEAKASAPASSKPSKKKSPPGAADAKADPKTGRGRSSQIKKSGSGPHASRVEAMLGELNDLIDEHEAELREVKDRVQQASVRSNMLRKLANKALKEAAHNPELEAELAGYRKKFESLRSLMG